MYSIYDANGFVDELATNLTIFEFQSVIDTSSSLYLKKFFDDGFTIEIDKVISDLESENFVIDSREFNNFVDLRSNLLDLAKKCKGVMILQNDSE